MTFLDLFLEIKEEEELELQKLQLRVPVCIMQRTSTAPPQAKEIEGLREQVCTLEEGMFWLMTQDNRPPEPVPTNQLSGQSLQMGNVPFSIDGDDAAFWGQVRELQQTAASLAMQSNNGPGSANKGPQK